MNSDDTAAAGVGNSIASTSVVDAQERWQRTAVTAFFLAEARGFAPGHELEDWLAAERLVDTALIAAAVPVDAVVAAEPLASQSAAAKAIRRPRKTAANPEAAGIEPAPKKKKSSAARKSTPRTRKSKPGIEADLGGMA